MNIADWSQGGNKSVYPKECSGRGNRMLINFIKRKLIKNNCGKRGLDMCNIEYINLSHRLDRRTAIEKELRQIGTKRFNRYNAHYASPGGLGCALSHLGVLKKHRNSINPLLVLEDDCEFLVTRNKIDLIVDEFMASSADILCLAYSTNVCIPFPSETLFRIKESQTTSCYLAKNHMKLTLIEVMEESIKYFRMNRPYEDAAIDQVWKKIQENYVFVAPLQRAARQRACFSDIEGAYVDYGV